MAAVDGRTLSGQSDGKAITIPAVQIKSIQGKHFSTGKTVGLVAGIGSGILNALAILGMCAIAHAFD